MCACVCDTYQPGVLSSGIVHLFLLFGDSLSLAWTLPSRLGCLARVPGTLCLLPSTGITATCHQVWIFFFNVGSKDRTFVHRASTFLTELLISLALFESSLLFCCFVWVLFSPVTFSGSPGLLLSTSMVPSLPGSVVWVPDGQVPFLNVVLHQHLQLCISRVSP